MRANAKSFYGFFFMTSVALLAVFSLGLAGTLAMALRLWKL
jgi:hypothetical protein